jgi:hypothetical protein
LGTSYGSNVIVRISSVVRAMGIFPNLLKGSRDQEMKIEDQYVPFFQMAWGTSRRQAKSAIRDIIEEVKQEYLNEDVRARLPANVGDFLLEIESSDEKIQSSLAKKREEGVRDEDIRWWFNMNDVEMSILLRLDDVNRRALFTRLRREHGLSEGEAAKGVRKGYPIFGDPDDTTATKGEDRPLPYELKDRIRSYVEKRMQGDPGTFKKEIEDASSFNALVRREVKMGSI